MKSQTFLKSRLKELQSKLIRFKADACVIDNTVDIFYLTGIELSLGRLLIDQKRAALFVDGRYFEAAKKRSPFPVVLASAASEKEFLKEKKIKTLLFDGAVATYEGYQKLDAFAKKEKLTLKSSPQLLKELRVIKDKQELAIMRKAAKLGWKGYEHVKKILKPGMTEKEVAVAYQTFCLKEGAEKLSFEPIIAFGPNAALPHHRASSSVYKKGEIALVDTGVVVDHYCSDMTRVIVPKEANPKMKKFYRIIQEAQKASLAECRPGACLQDLDLAARAVMKREGVEKYFVHSLGHGVGLEIHEFPRIKFDHADRNVILEPGMVITIEPGLYLPGIGGVRYEDTIAITSRGYENFYGENE